MLIAFCLFHYQHAKYNVHTCWHFYLKTVKIFYSSIDHICEAISLFVYAQIQEMERGRAYLAHRSKSLSPILHVFKKVHSALLNKKSCAFLFFCFFLCRAKSSKFQVNLQSFCVGMHDIIDTSSVSADKSSKMKYQHRPFLPIMRGQFVAIFSVAWLCFTLRTVSPWWSWCFLHRLHFTQAARQTRGEPGLTLAGRLGGCQAMLRLTLR